MKRQPLLIVILLLTINIVGQSDNSLLIGELTVTQSAIEKVKVGDTLTFLFTKKQFEGSIKIHTDNSIYVWTTCALNQKEYSWCKIGTWNKSNFVVFNLNCKTILLKNITPDIGPGKQRLIIQDIK